MRSRAVSLPLACWRLGGLLARTPPSLLPEFVQLGHPTARVGRDRGDLLADRCIVQNRHLEPLHV